MRLLAEETHVGQVAAGLLLALVAPVRFGKIPALAESRRRLQRRRVDGSDDVARAPRLGPCERTPAQSLVDGVLMAQLPRLDDGRPPRHLGRRQQITSQGCEARRVDVEHRHVVVAVSRRRHRQEVAVEHAQLVDPRVEHLSERQLGTSTAAASGNLWITNFSRFHPPDPFFFFFFFFLRKEWMSRGGRKSQGLVGRRPDP